MSKTQDWTDDQAGTGFAPVQDKQPSQRPGRGDRQEPRMQNDIETGIYRVAAKLTAEAPREQDGSCVRLRDQLAWNPRSAYESFPNDRSLINPAAAQCLECYLCLQPDKTGE